MKLNKLTVEMGVEDLSRLTMEESDIHYPTNNSLAWDCIKESRRLLEWLSAALTASVLPITAPEPRGRTLRSISQKRG